MGKHLYDSRLTKVVWFVKRFGAPELALKPIRILFAPIIIHFLPAETFIFKGESLKCFYHPYNMTWASERCIEIPIGWYYLHVFNSEATLEVGNVLSHYTPVRHQVLDKFEKGARVINQDILSFSSPKKYALILSISTFEHIGFDDEPGEGSSAKITQAIDACRKLLSPQGRLVLTLPIGYNPELDQLISAGALASGQERYLEFYFKRTAARHWEAATKEDALACEYKRPFPYANAILVAEIPPKSGV